MDFREAINTQYKINKIQRKYEKKSKLTLAHAGIYATI